MTEGELGKIVHLDSGTLAPLLKRLEKQGLATRERPKSNENKLYVSLTKKGEELKEKALCIPQKMQGCIPLSTEELNQLKAILDRALITMEK